MGELTHIFFGITTGNTSGESGILCARSPPLRADEGLPACQDGAGHPVKGAGELGHGSKAAIAAADLPAAVDIAAPGDRSVFIMPLADGR